MKRSAFTLTELLVAISIVMAAAAVSMPVLGALLRETRLGGAVSRLRAGLQQTRAILSDYELADRSATEPAINGAIFTGTALVCRWDDTLQDYEVFYALSAQAATDAGGAYLSSRTPALRGYTRFSSLEPMTLGSGLRLAGLRRNATGAGSGVELVPSPTGSFAVCMDATGVGIPPGPAIYVNLQEAPARGGRGPWNAWDTAMYDGVKADGSLDAGSQNTGAYAGAWVDPLVSPAAAGKGEGFLTALPMVIVYRDEDLPMAGASPSGTPWRVANPANPGSPRVNPALNPNELLAKTKGRVVMLTMQGGSPAEY